MKISVVIVHWNNVELLEKQLSCFEFPSSTEVVVVDNASSESLSLLQKKFPHVKFILNDVNRGYSFACNQGTRASSSEWILFLNPDVKINATQIDKMLEYANNHEYAAVSPLFDSKDYQKPIPSLFSILSEFTPLSKVVSSENFGGRTLVGGCLLIQRNILEELHGWDERFFLWFEDSDLSDRLEIEGKQYGFYPHSDIGHLGGSSFSQLDKQLKRDMFFHSLNIFSRKHFELISQILVKKVSRRYSTRRLLAQDKKLRISIVVPNMKFELLESFLKENYTFFEFSTQELIIVTSCVSYESLRVTYPEVIFIYQAKNKGFAHTVNTGMQRARGEYIGTVNDDVLLNKSWLGPIEKEFSSKEKIGSVSPLIKKMDGSVESLGVNVLPIGKADVQKEVKPKAQSSAFNAAAVVFTRLALEELGLFDERFESYLEDVDLGLRFSRNGWLNVATSESSVVHLGQQTSQTLRAYKNWLDVRNWWFVLLKNYSLRELLKNAGPILVERGRNISGMIKSL